MTAFAESSAESRVEQLALAHVSLELGHLYMEDFAGGPEQLRRHFREVRPWADAVRARLAQRLGERRPRVSTCFLIDDYFTRFSTPEVVFTQLREAAEENGLTIDYIAREAGCAQAGNVSPAALVLDRIVAEPSAGTGGAWPSPRESGWLSNGGRLPGEAARPAMSAAADWLPPMENARNRHSIVVAVEIFSENAGGRLWSCPYLAAVWQLMRLGMLRDDGAPVARPEQLSGPLPAEWDQVPAVVQLNPKADPFSAYRTVSVLATRFLPIEDAVRVVLSQVAVDDEVQAQVQRRAAGEGLEVSSEVVRRIGYVMDEDTTRVV